MLIGNAIRSTAQELISACRIPNGVLIKHRHEKKNFESQFPRHGRDGRRALVELGSESDNSFFNVL